jgi:hypothetical protein
LSYALHSFLLAPACEAAYNSALSNLPSSIKRA